MRDRHEENDYYKDAPVIENLSPDKPKKNDRKQRGEKPSDAEKDRRTAARGMARVYVNVGKRDGFYAGNLIDILNHVVPGQRVDVGRIVRQRDICLFPAR